MKTRHFLTLLSITGALLASDAQAAESPGDAMLADYFRRQTAAIEGRAFADIRSLDDWKRQRETYLEQLREMLGLSPLPERTPLNATITGREEHAEFTVEKLHYQSVPGLYITANLYIPKPRPTKAPTILYLSGHSRQREGKVSFGSKVAYQHHGIWFARNGYVCLTLDSIGELAEIEGQHHGTHTAGRWWWNSRGYSPAGLEAWNAMRGLDYLETRPEVDPQRFGVTGRSGGGVGTWWTAAIDERVKVAVPVAGMTDLLDQVVHGKVSRHCDCMFMVNTHRWDYGRIAAMLAPRPLLISNSDKDDIFPLDGVIRIHHAAARIYGLYGANDKLGLTIADGPHKDTQELQVPAFRWFNRFLKGDQSVIDGAANKLFTPAQLRVFSSIPADEKNTTIDQTFVPAAKPEVPANREAWVQARDSWLRALNEKCFAAWPAEEPLGLTKSSAESHAGVTLSRWEFTSQGPIKLPLFVFTGPRAAGEVHLFVLDEAGWRELADAARGRWSLPSGAAPAAGDPGAGATLRPLLERVARGEITLACLPPRGIGPTAWSGNEAAQTHIRRRFMLLGETLDSTRVWDIRRALAALSQPELFPNQHVHLQAERAQAVNALYASLYARTVAAIELKAAPASHASGPDYLNVLRFVDVPQIAAVAAERVPVRVAGGRPADWSWTFDALQQLGWPRDRFQVTP